METRSPASVACCAALLIMTVPLMAQAASNTLVLTDAEPQYARKLCWAAADVLAVNNFYPHCPSATATPAAIPPAPTSQAVEAGYNYLGISGSPATSLGSYLTKCEAKIGDCNFWGTPQLNGLTFLPGPGSMGLDWDTVTQEIDAGRPFLFVWKYPPDGTYPGSPVDSHELVATGYSDERDSSHARYLQIWDPWPAPDSPPSQVPACGPASGLQADPVSSPHSQWIFFSTYTDPSNDMGVMAVHADDQWHLVALSTPQPPVLTVDRGPPPFPHPNPPPFRALPQPPGTPSRPLSFTEALGAALPQSRQIDLRLSGAPPRSLGVPFPIVGLGFQQLLRASANPTRLLAGTTSAILFPVESQGKVVDAFLMLFIEGRWQRGGYANVEITRRLVDVRARYAAEQHVPLDALYMVSVPGEVAFFAAYGRGEQAVLIPASTDPTIDAVAGRAVPADKQLRRLIEDIQLDLKRYPNRSGRPVRPRG